MRAAHLVLALLLPALAGCGLGGLPDPSGLPDGGGEPGIAPPPSETELAWALELLERVNAERAANSLPPLAWHEGAAGVAYAHAYDMDVRSFFDHVNPDGKDPGDRLHDAGIGWSAYGENIARGQPTPSEVMTAWMGSSGHRANILSPFVTHMGAGVHMGGSRGPWWVQVFLTPTVGA